MRPPIHSMDLAEFRTKVGLNRRLSQAHGACAAIRTPISET